MPQAVPAIIIAAGQATAGVAVAKVIGLFVVNVALSYLSTALSKKRGEPGLPPVNVTVNDSVEWRHIVLGTRRVGGSFVDIRTSSGGVNSPNKFLWYVVAYADHQCNALKDAYFDEFVVPAADINAGTGAVSTAWANGKVWIWNHLGTQAQTADAQMTSTFSGGGGGGTAWGANDRLRGVCYRVIKMERDDTAFPTGAPDHVSSIVEGALTYDWRLDSTNGGSGAHRMNDPSTWSFSNNWARNVQWLASGGSVVNDQATRLVKYGIKEDYSRIDWPFWATAANVSDQQLTGANTTPGGDEKRYTLDAEFTCGQTRGEILDLAMAAGAGEMVYVHGKWRLYAGAYDTPVHSFTQDDLRGDMEVEDTTDEQERINRVSAIYVDPTQQWKEQTTPYRFSAAYDTQDQGREFAKEPIDLRTVTSAYQAQRICELELRKARQMRRIVFRFGRNGMKIAPHETFYFSHTRLGWVNREFRCVKRRRERTQDGGIITVITARSEAASMYTDLVTADYSSGTSITNSIQSEAPEPPTNVRVNGLPNAVEIAWDQSAVFFPGGTRYRVQQAAAADMSGATEVAFTPDRQVLLRQNDTTTRYYRVRGERVGQVSAWVPSGNGAPGAALNATTALSATVSPASIAKLTTSASDNSASATVTASGGTAPYTYAWTRISGATEITANSTTAATTSFNCTGLAAGEVNNAVFRCTVTDSVSATATADVSVQFTREGIAVSATNVSKSKSGFAACGSITGAGSPNVTVTGGSGSYTYAWTQVGTPATSGPYVVSSATAQNPTWSDTVCAADANKAETWKVTVTDTVSGATAEASISVTLNWIDLS